LKISGSPIPSGENEWFIKSLGFVNRAMLQSKARKKFAGFHCLVIQDNQQKKALLFCLNQWFFCLDQKDLRKEKNYR